MQFKCTCNRSSILNVQQSKLVLFLSFAGSCCPSLYSPALRNAQAIKHYRNGVCVNWSEISVHRTESLSHSKFYCICGKTNLMLDLLVDECEVDKVKNMCNNSNKKGDHYYHHLWTWFVCMVGSIALFAFVCEWRRLQIQSKLNTTGERICKRNRNSR